MSSTSDQSNDQLPKEDDHLTSDQSNDQLPKEDDQLTPNQSKQSSNEDNLNQNKNLKIACLDMCFFCFDMLRFHFDLDVEPIPKFTDESYPLFVTWSLGKSKALRGCIGNFSALNLHYGLSEYSIISATQDSRFSPITKDELSELHVSVSILLDFENSLNYLDWEIGKHGILIEFENENGLKKSATYLPDIAVLRNWNKVETIDHLLRKGGYKAVITEDLRKTIKLTRYQTEKITASYEEYMKSKNI